MDVLSGTLYNFGNPLWLGTGWLESQDFSWPLNEESMTWRVFGISRGHILEFSDSLWLVFIYVIAGYVFWSTIARKINVTPKGNIYLLPKVTFVTQR